MYNKKTIKKRIGSVGILALVSLLVFSGIANTVYAAADIIPNVAAQAEQAARVHIVTQKMNRCIDSIIDSLTTVNSSQATSGDIYSGYTNIAVGSWLESRVLYGRQADNDNSIGNDGEIWCKENDGAITEVFAQELGISISDIICDGQNPGILQAYTVAHRPNGGGYLVTGSATCGSSGDNIRYGVNADGDDRSAAHAYLQKVYEKWVSTSGNPYAVSWSNLNNYDGIDGYYAFRADLGKTCSGLSDSGGLISVDIVEDSKSSSSGQIVSKTVSPTKSDSKAFSSFVDATYVGGESGHKIQMTCAAVAEAVTKAAPTYQRAIIERLGDSCYDEYNNTISEYTDEAVSKFNSLASSGDAHHTNFVDGVDNTNVNLECVYIGDKKGSNPGETIPGGVVQEESDQESVDNITYNTDTDEDGCFDSAQSLGWILCPLIKGIATATDGLYESIVEPFLAINVSTFDTNSGAFVGWQTFQSFANVVFVIVFLIVILSQVTGFGIDNLGIKRMLPKLIIAAVLVNLSWIICMLLVDASNIVGYGAKSLFDNINVGSSVASAGRSVVTTLTTGVLGGGVIVGAGFTVGLWAPFTVVPLLLGLIGMLISILFMFILLGVRQAGVILLVVVSPLAFVLYMLPNTKPVFDRWRKMFTGLLLLYPICGLLMGGADFAGRIIAATSSGFWVNLVAALLSTIVFFLVPTLLRQSMTAMGNIGARISSIGQNFSRGAQQRVGNSQAVRDFQTRLAAGVDRNGNQTWLSRRRDAIANANPDSRFGRLMRATGLQRSASRSAASGRAAYIKDQDEQDREAMLNNPNYMENYQRQQQIKQEKEAVAMDMDIVNDNTAKGEDQNALFDMYNEAVRSGNKTRVKAIAEIAGRRKDTANAFAQKFKEDTASGLYDGQTEMLQAAAKQMSTGDNSKNYRAANATAFEYASQVNRGADSAKNASGAPLSYADWSDNADNIHSAINNHITNGAELYGQSGATLRELAKVATNHTTTDKDGNTIEVKDATYLANLAKRAESEGKAGTGAYDATKDNEIANLKNIEDGIDIMHGDGEGI